MSANCWILTMRTTKSPLAQKYVLPDRKSRVRTAVFEPVRMVMGWLGTNARVARHTSSSLLGVDRGGHDQSCLVT